MAKADIERKSLKIAVFVNAELDLLVEDLYTAGTDASKGAVVGALVCAARRSPIEAVAAVVQTYVIREAVEAASRPPDDPSSASETGQAD